MNVEEQLAPSEHERLIATLRARHPNGPLSTSVPRLHGFFASVVSGPLISPSEWMQVIFGQSDDERAWNTLEDAQAALGLLMRCYNEVARSFEQGQRDNSLGIINELIADAIASHVALRDWCEGYILGILLRKDEWDEPARNPETRLYLDPIVMLADPARAGLDPIADPRQYQAVAASLPLSALRIQSWWRVKLVGQATSTIGRAKGSRVRRSGKKRGR